MVLFRKAYLKHRGISPKMLKVKRQKKLYQANTAKEKADVIILIPDTMDLKVKRVTRGSGYLMINGEIH